MTGWFLLTKGSMPLLAFVLGFILALLLVIPTAVLLYRHRAKNAKSRNTIQQNQFEELAKLTGGLAHEIKNPLSTIKINLKLITEDAQAPETNPQRWLKKVNVVQKETDRLEQILDDFLRFIGKSELSTAPADINTLISDTADFYSPQARAKNVTIRLGLAKNPIICKIDPDMIKQVILNLFINATQAMPEGGELIVRTDMIDKNAKIEISDTGTGIEPDKIDQIFQAYYTSRPGGSGLGLPIAKKIIDAHHGQISVNSQPSKGTSFSITLPAQSA
jgi:signal transduction histidine kinase